MRLVPSRADELLINQESQRRQAGRRERRKEGKMRGGTAGLDKLNDESGFSRLNNGSTTISEVKTAVEYCSRPPAIFRNGYTETIVNKSRQLHAT